MSRSTNSQITRLLFASNRGRRVRSCRTRVDAPPSLTIDAATHSATLDGHPLDLTPVELRLLTALHAEPGRVIKRDKLVTRLYVDHRVVSSRTVDSHVKNLRRKLALAANGEDLIRSVYGVGYRLEV